MNRMAWDSLHDSSNIFDGVATNIEHNSLQGGGGPLGKKWKSMGQKQ